MNEIQLQKAVELQENSPFRLENTDAYLCWREWKLSNAQTSLNRHLKMLPPHFYEVFLNSDTLDETLTFDNIDPILNECAQNNYCLYFIQDHQNLDCDQTKQLIHKFTQKCGLSKLNHNLCADEDSITAICQSEHKNQHGYIPYSNKALSWHTDGYYNLPENTIYSMLLHCFNPASHGGESAFMDHEIAYILLRDKNPEWIKALSQPQAMTIPANELDGKIIRDTQTGPVFSVTPQGRLHMRYSARKRNIIWQQDRATSEALDFLDELFSNGSKYIIKHKLKAGEGIITRNVLHRREAFVDDVSTQNQRLLFRGRFYDELAIPQPTLIA